MESHNNIGGREVVRKFGGGGLEERKGRVSNAALKRDRERIFGTLDSDIVKGGTGTEKEWGGGGNAELPEILKTIFQGMTHPKEGSI